MDPHLSSYTQDLVLPYSAVNAAGQIRMDRLLTLFQDAAAAQCHAFGISGFDLAKKNLKWVISRYQVQIYRPLGWLDRFRLITWRKPWKNLYELRRFSLVSEGDNLEIVSALGVWIMVKAGSGKPVRLSSYLPQELMVHEADPPDLLPVETPGMPYDQTKDFRVRTHDLDMNHHVNNTVYVQWAMEALPDAFTDSHIPSTFVIRFLKQAFYPDRIRSGVTMENKEGCLLSHHRISSHTTGKDLAGVCFSWMKKEDDGAF